MKTFPARPLLMMGGALFLCVILLSCARHIKEDRFAQANAEYHILIASNPSEFKDGIRNRLIENYRTTANIDVVNISSLREIREDRYDAILIMDSCIAWSHLNLSFKSFLDDLERKDHVVLFLTTGGSEWDYQYRGLDAITSASVIDHQDDMFNQLKARIDEILTGQ